MTPPDAFVDHDGTWRPGGDHDTVRFGPGTHQDVSASGSRFLECAFTGTSLEGGDLRRSRFIGVRARELRMVGTDLDETAWQDCTLHGSVAGGVSLAGARLDRVHFTDCKLDGVNFRDSTLTGVVFEDCLLREADFTGASLTRTAFPGSRLTGTRFVRTRLDRADLRGAELGLIIEPAALQGAVITPAQLEALAPLLAGALGIEIEPQDLPED